MKKIEVGTMNTFIFKIFDIWKRPKLKHHIVIVLLLAVLLAFGWGAVYLEGGTALSCVHFMYIPIIIASFFWGIYGGIIVSVLASILVGPLMPLNIEDHLNQPPSSILIRTLFFIIISLFVGYISTLLKTYIIFANKTYRQLSSTYANTLRNYAQMLANRDKQIAEHCERVAYNSMMVGIEYGLHVYDAEALYWAGLLHDVGKINIPEEILLKPEKLTNEEYLEIQQHTVLGYELINSVSKDLHQVSTAIRAHHEKWNGEGYPDGLKGEDIPLFGRIISIVDVYEALTSTRPYKSSWCKKHAIEYITKEKGKSFDPKLVDLFIKLHNEGKIWTYGEPIQLNEQIIPQTFHIHYDGKRFLE